MTFFQLALLLWVKLVVFQGDLEPQRSTLASEYSQFRSKWDNVEFAARRKTWLEVGGSKSLITFEDVHVARIGGEFSVHSKSVDNPKYIEELGITYGESVRASLTGENGGVIIFSRDASSPENVISPNPFESFDVIDLRWQGSLFPSESVNSQVFPVLQWFEDYDFPSEILRETARLEKRNFTVEGLGTRKLFTVKIEPAKHREITLVFDERGDNFPPVGLVGNATQFDIPFKRWGYRSIGQVPESRLRQFPRSLKIEQWFIEGKSNPVFKTRRETVFFDGSSEIENEEVEFSVLNFDPSSRVLSLYVDIPNKTEVSIASSPQIKAQWIDGNVVEVYREDVIQNLGTARIIRPRPYVRILLLGLFAAGVISVAVLLIRKVRLFRK